MLSRPCRKRRPSAREDGGQDEALARWSTPREVQRSILKSETVLGTLYATPKVPHSSPGAGAFWAQTEDPSGCGAASPRQGCTERIRLFAAMLGTQFHTQRCPHVDSQPCVMGPGDSQATPAQHLAVLGPSRGCSLGPRPLPGLCPLPEPLSPAYAAGSSSDPASSKEPALTSSPGAGTSFPDPGPPSRPSTCSAYPLPTASREVPGKLSLHAHGYWERFIALETW